jgi:hypothetical protein
MLLYDWKKLLIVSNRKIDKVVLALRAMTSDRPPLNQYDPIYKYYYKDLSGNSFLLNPVPLLRSAYTNKEIVEYVGLASFRNYSTYLTTGDARLDVLHSPVSIQTINKNRLLSVEDDHVLFKYEEVI